MPVLALLLTASLWAQGFVAERHRNLARTLDRLESAGARSGLDYRREVAGLVSGFQGLMPLFPQFAPRDYETNRELVRRSLAWFALLEAQALRDPRLGRDLSGAYSFFGDYQASPALRPYGFTGGVPVGYGRAGRLSRRLWLGGNADFESDIERYALSLATWNAGLFGWGAWRAPRPPEGLDAVDFELPPSDRKPVPVPELDPSLPEATRLKWRELAPSFAAVAARVHQAHRNLDALALRLERRGMTVNARDLAISYQMQGFLEDAAELARQGNLEQAKLALDRASYTCNQLKPVTGQ